MQKPSPSATMALDEAYGGGLRIQTILCPVDLSEPSRNALHYAARLASHFGARLFVQHTFKRRAGASKKNSNGTLTIEELAAPQQQAELELRAMLEHTGLDATRTSLLLNDGDPCERILETVARRGIDLMVIGTRGRTGLARLVMGSITERVIHEAPCPVFVISRQRAHYTRGEFSRSRYGRLKLNTILVATDLSHNANRLLLYALRWASETSSRLILFHCVATAPTALAKVSDLLPEYDSNLEKSLREASDKMRALIPSPSSLPCKVEFEVRDGDALGQLLLFADDRRPDLLVLGARIGRGPLWGSVISGVIRYGRFPVLAVRHRGE